MKTFRNLLNFSALATVAAFTVIGSASAQITIVNQDTQPVPVKEVRAPGITPFQYEFAVNMPAGERAVDSQYTGQFGHALIGEVYVVEHVAFQGACTGGAATDIAIGLNVHAPNIKPPSKIDLTLWAGNASAGAANLGVIGSFPMRAYLPIATTFSGFAVRNGQTGQCGGTISVTGYVQKVNPYPY